MKYQSILLSLIVLLHYPAFCETDDSKSEFEKTDEICQLLYDSYLIRRGKSGSGPLAPPAEHIVVQRGRLTDFWKFLLNEIEREDGDNKHRCAVMLGRMLALDAAARDGIFYSIKPRPENSRVLLIDRPCLGKEVTTELIKQANMADRWDVDSYLVALVRARTYEPRELFQSVLRNNTGKMYMDDAQFYAALGLAHMGVLTGFEWLFDNQGAAGHLWPRLANSGARTLGPSCTAALMQLTGGKALRDKKELESWLKTVKRKELVKNYVMLD